jgi:hypothetical protein
MNGSFVKDDFQILSKQSLVRLRVGCCDLKLIHSFRQHANSLPQIRYIAV